jgi:hypothetical protein
MQDAGMWVKAMETLVQFLGADTGIALADELGDALAGMLEYTNEFSQLSNARMPPPPCMPQVWLDLSPALCILISFVQMTDLRCCSLLACLIAVIDRNCSKLSCQSINWHVQRLFYRLEVQVTDVMPFLAQSISQLSQRRPGTVGPALSAPNAAASAPLQQLRSYLTSTGVPIS